MKKVIKIEKNGANGDLAKTVNTRHIFECNLIQGTDFRSKMSKSSGGYQF